MMSAELFSIEEGLVMSSYIVSSPFINIIAYVIIGVTLSWWYALSTFLLWFVIYIIQYLISKISNVYRRKEAALNDRRIYLVNEMITGITSIKCFGWE